MSADVNDQMFLIGGYSSTGKSASLQNIRNQEHWLFLNTEAGKRLPFKNNFQSHRISDPLQIYEAFDYGTGRDDIHGIIIDSLTFLMDMYETQNVLNASNTMKAWGDFAQFFKVMMQEKVVLFNKPVIFTAHVMDILDEKAMEMKTSVPIKGSLKNQGVEAYFSTVVASEKMTLKELEPYRGDNSLLNITEEDELLGFKYVFQTRLTKATTGKRIRSPMGLFSRQETYMDNDSQLLLDRLHQFYEG
jgi:hypothetical protein